MLGDSEPCGLHSPLTEATSVLLNSAIGAEGAEALERPDAPDVTVGPVRLQGVVADRIYGLESEGLGAVALRPATGHAAKKVGLAGTDRAGTSPAELLQRIV